MKRPDIELLKKIIWFTGSVWASWPFAHLVYNVFKFNQTMFTKPKAYYANPNNKNSAVNSLIETSAVEV